MPVERTTVVPDPSAEDIENIVTRGPVVTGDQEVDDVVADYVSVLRQVGGGFMVTAERQKVGQSPNGEPLYVTRGYVVRYNSFVPTVSGEPDQPTAAAPEPEPAAVE